MDGSEAHDSDVLVVGAGPVGLMAAAEAARHGATVRIVERATERSELSRALVIHARTLEVFDLAGIADEFVRSGYPAPGLNIGLSDTRAPISVDLRRIDSRFPYALILPQRQTEELLEKHLATFGITVHYGTELTEFTRYTDDLVATLRSADGSAVRHRSRFLIGADGAHSTTRKLLDLPFVGDQSDETVLIGDVRLDTSLIRTRITNYTSDRGFVSLLPFLGDHVRVFVVDFARQDRGRHDALTLAELQDAANAILPEPVTMTDARWLTRYVAPSRQVSTPRVGRVFLVGDAAHAHSPAAGQGMNTGLQDAANLAWKVAMVASGKAPSTLLGTYATERQPVHSAVVRATDQMFRSFTVHNPLLRSVRNAAARIAVPTEPVQRKLTGSLSGIGIHYRLSDRRPTLRNSTGLRAGDRLPDVTLLRLGQGPVRAYELLRHPGYTLFLYVSADHSTQDPDQVGDLAAYVARTYPDSIQPQVVIDEGVMHPDATGGMEVSIDVRGEVAAKWDLAPGSALLVRPDGYVAFHAGSLQKGAVTRPINQWASRDRPEVRQRVQLPKKPSA